MSVAIGPIFSDEKTEAYFKYFARDRMAKMWQSPSSNLCLCALQLSTLLPFWLTYFS